MARIAVYDACILYPVTLRSLLVQVGQMGFVQARWSERIHTEWIEGVLRRRPELDRSALRTVSELMNAAVPDCLVTGYEPWIAELALPDPDDRHVLAAAIVAKADTLVTANLKDFPMALLAPHGIQPMSPDLFVSTVLAEQPAAIAAVRACRLRLLRPAQTVDEYLATLLRQGLAETVAYLSTHRRMLE